jgi:tyrosyl-DNA phosphodiesterase 2
MPAAPGNSLLAELAAERLRRRGAPPPVDPPTPALAELKLLSFNLWFREDVALAVRMRAFGQLLVAERPHVVCLQEITPLMQSLLARQEWWADYAASPAPPSPYYTLLLVRKPLLLGQISRTAFPNSQMSRDVCGAWLSLGGGVRLYAANSHLESWTGPDATAAEERRGQVSYFERAILPSLLTSADGAHKNILWAGDLNWNEKTDGPLKAPQGFVDAWSTLHPRDPGLTYDLRTNAMLGGGLAMRLDRCLCRLEAYELAEARLVGRDAIPGETYENEFRGKVQRKPVLISDHYGLCVTLRRKA